MKDSLNRYHQGAYNVDFGDDRWKARQMMRILSTIPDRESVTTYADVGCGNGGTFLGIRDLLVESGFPVAKAIGYDVRPLDGVSAGNRPGVEFRNLDFTTAGEPFDLVTLNDVVEHVVAPQRFLERVAAHARYVALHIPLDDRWSVVVGNTYNFRLGPVGHISFWNQSTALNLLTSAGLTPLQCVLTPGFLAPSGRARLIQRLAIPVRWLLWNLNPGIMSRTVGGASLAVLCRGNRP